MKIFRTLSRFSKRKLQLPYFIYFIYKKCYKNKIKFLFFIFIFVSFNVISFLIIKYYIEYYRNLFAISTINLIGKPKENLHVENLFNTSYLKEYDNFMSLYRNISSRKNTTITKSYVLINQNTKPLKINIKLTEKFKPSKDSRCDEIRRRVSWGIVEYAEWDGDEKLRELLQPVFSKKRLVVWAIDVHPGPTDDIRSILEPLGVEFIQHLYHERQRCQRRCACHKSPKAPKVTQSDIFRPNKKVFEEIYNDKSSATDMARADAFITGQCLGLIELYRRYNKSIISISPIRYHLPLTNIVWSQTDSEGFHYVTDFDPIRLRQMNNLLVELMKYRKHVIGANSLYDVEFMHYFVGTRPEYVPGFAGYTGEHYQPSKSSFLYARQPYGVNKFWNEAFNKYFKFINATFNLKEIKDIYKTGYEYSDLAKHLGIVHQPYQVFLCNSV